MKFLVERDLLIDAVNWVARSLSVRPIQTSLLGIVINVDDVITFTSSNLETTTEAVIKADILEKGRVLVPGRLLADIARALPDKPITFALEGTRVLVNAGSAKFQLPTLPIEEFPPLTFFCTILHFFAQNTTKYTTSHFFGYSKSSTNSTSSA